MRTLNDHLRLNRRRYPERIAVVDEARSITYAELIDRSWALARGLRGAGVGAGETVGILAGNGIFLVEAYFGALAAGAVPVMYNWRWAPPELAFALEDSGARVVFADREHAELLERARAGAERELPLERVVREGAELEALLDAGPPPAVAPALGDPAAIIYTGGTTGFPKGVVLSHGAVMANCVCEIADTRMVEEDRTLVIAPLFHAASLCCWFLPHFLLGARSVLMRKFDEEQVAATIARERVTNGYLAPNMVRRLLAAEVLSRVDASSYVRMYVGGAAFRMPDKLAIRELLPQAEIYYQYGLTEAAGIVTRLLPSDMYRADVDGSIGREFLLWEIAVRDLDGGADVGVGEVGELWLRGPGAMSGYYRRPQETAETLQDGWLRTGDLVSRDADGFVYHHDRSKDMIKSGGENVYSAEVERALYGHPAVAEVAVVGVPSSEWDEEVCAVVVLKDGAGTSAHELRDHCRPLLAGYKIPKRVAFVAREQLPVNDSGKIVKTRIRELGLFPGLAGAEQEAAHG